MDSEIYGEIILDHYRHPRNKGTLKKPDIEARDTNPICGDVIEIQIKLNKKKKVSEVRFDGNGCAVSQASASMLTELVKGKSLEELRKLDKKDLLDILGIDFGPLRIKCALLSLKVLKLGVYDYLGEKDRSDLRILS